MDAYPSKQCVGHLTTCRLGVGQVAIWENKVTRTILNHTVATAGDFDGVDLSAQLAGSTPVDRTLYWRFKANEQAAIRDGD